ncbi:TPA: hypothetical protein NJ528_004663 [Vibrio parahaemolyticus]|uniref:hypothetical protein n=1 Tax=Vibrio parahaemolyticus TaxID=670 RepID=UPI0032994C77|nr:hypothetical protein [Vibrio parahaemolyticus]HCE4653407.1 hypothetical protein [Vibrio parahaemolyticus]HCG8290650.1 hypothetical protein [Vibrio parahaemolyticus]HCG8295838.1 hypothetical protein [Vibrio parahaemolyticus]HCG8301063.1 hypothetical protein [Vibrio parahaemolyticus]
MEHSDNVVDIPQQDKDELIKPLKLQVSELKDVKSREMDEQERQYFIRQAELKNDRARQLLLVVYLCFVLQFWFFYLFEIQIFT